MTITYIRSTGVNNSCYKVAGVETEAYTTGELSVCYWRNCCDCQISKLAVPV